MNFKNNEAIFRSTAANHRIHPLGPTKRAVVGTGWDTTTVPVPKPCVEFENNMANVTEPETVRGMFASDWFGRNDGFVLVLACLPDKLQSLWSRLNTKTKRSVGSMLVDNTPEDDVITSLKDEDYDSAADVLAEESDAGHEIFIKCDIPGCKSQPFPATPKTALELLRIHKIAKHSGEQPAA